MLTFAMRCNLGVTLTELTKPQNVTVSKKVGNLKDDLNISKNQSFQMDETMYDDVVEKVATLD